MPSRRCQQGRILPALATVGAASGRNWSARCYSKAGLGQPALWLSPDRRLLRREGWQVNPKRVLRVMGEDNLLCLRTRPFVPRTMDSRHSWRVVPNLARGMELTGVNQLWVADITYLHLAEQFAYLAVVLDAFSRKVIGWALELHLRASLAVDALKMAISARVPVPGSLIHHSDRGVQYACTSYSDILHRHGIQPSMSRVGNPYDNARAESFMKTLKQEEVAGLAYRDAPDARRRIASFIEDVYNRQRLHSALDYLTRKNTKRPYDTIGKCRI
ncbi:IS3 family transposase [Mesorhizobium sp. M0960]|uniref:IS3 family transposase n=1 Tax=Mesorhizobium sp. M0960 TaxID=2957035 RepID=UPI00333DB56F